MPRFLTPALLCLLLQGPPSPAPPPALGSAIARLQANYPAGAARILEEVTKREPANGRAWRNLGLARQMLKDLDQSAAAYQRALDVEPSMPMPLYNLGVVYALKQDRDRAFEWLQRAKASKKIDMSQAAVAPELAFLKADPRFAALLPVRADFEHPFVEDVRILHEWDGDAAQDQFGWIARNLGDVDGDAITDVVTS